MPTPFADRDAHPTKADRDAHMKGNKMARFALYRAAQTQARFKTPKHLFYRITHGYVTLVYRLGVYAYNNAIAKSEIGLIDKHYKPNVHGPYCHWRYYGPNSKLIHLHRHRWCCFAEDTPLMDVKLGDLRAYLSRRDMSIGAIYREWKRQFHIVKWHYFGASSHMTVGHRMFWHAMWIGAVLMCILRAHEGWGYDESALYHW